MQEGFALLLDSQPITWTSQEDRHLLWCRALVQAGIKPVLIFSGPLKREFEEIFVANGAVVVSLRYQSGLIRFYRTLKEIVNRYHIRLVHIIFFDYFSAVAWIVRATGVKQIVYEMQNSGIFKATSWRKILLHIRTKLTTAPMHRIIAISGFVKDQLINAGVNETKIVVRYLGIDNRRFEPDSSARTELVERLNIRSDESILCTVSYLRPFKNPQVLVEACRELKERNLPFRLVVAGDGDMLPDLKDLGKRLGVDDVIHWLGNVDDPKRLLQASDIFLLASTGEAFGLVLVEAMACGVPVVGVRSGSLPEVVEEGKTGLLVAPYDAKGLASSIEALCGNEALHRSMSKQCIERVKSCFTVELAVLRTLNIYKDLSWPADQARSFDSAMDVDS